MPINLVYRGGSGTAVTVPSGTVIWDGEKYVTYAGEELVIGGSCECGDDIAALDERVTAVNTLANNAQSAASEAQESVTSLESRIDALEEEDVSLDARITALESIGIAEEGAY